MPKTKRQLEVPGTERKKLKEANDAAEAYVDARDTRMRHTEKEVEARDALVAVMEKHHLTVYRDDEADPPLVVTLTPGKAKVKVRRADDDDDDAEESEAADG
jgi:hypothetical protein